MFQPDYIDFLHTLRLPEFHLDVRDGQFTMEFFGAWPSWNSGEFQSPDINLDGGNRRLDEKIQTIKRNPGITFSDFGSRRRWSPKWQERVVGRFAEELPGRFRGTSNSEGSISIIVFKLCGIVYGNPDEHSES